MTRNTKIALVVLVAATLTGCAQEAPVTPPPVESTSSSTPTGTGKGEALDKLRPCDMVDAAMAAQLKVRDSKDVSISGVRSCRWLAEGNAVFSINIFDNKGVADYVVGKGTVSDVKVGRHSGKQEEGFDGAGGCSIVLGVSGSSRVDIRSVAGIDHAKACKLAMDGATAVEPKLQ